MDTLQAPDTQHPTPLVDKKMGEATWEEMIEWMVAGQKLKEKASYSQDFARIEFPEIERPICVVPISDLHIGSWCTDYALFKQITDEIVNTPDLYTCIVGDTTQAAIKMRSVIEVSDNLLQPEQQDAFIEGWFEKIEPKTLFATWDNHGVMRQEAAIGYSPLARIFKKKVVYFPHIGHADIVVGNQTYKIAVSHRFRGNSIYNVTHAQQRYMRFEGIDREICIQGDTHTAGYSWYYDGPVERLAINCGTLQLHSGFGKRFFSLFTHPAFPCFTLDPNEHHFDVFKSVARWKAAQVEGVQQS